MSVRDDELMPVQCDGCDLLTFEPQYCEECAEEGRTARFCSSSACRDHANEHEPRDLLVAHMAEQRRHLTDLFEDDDGFDLLRLRVVDPDLPFTDQCRRLLDKLFRDFASARSALDAKDARLMEA